MAIVTGNSNVITGTDGNDRLYGTSGPDVITEGTGPYGSASNDRLSGGAGNDLLEGGNGNDRLYGGAGDDILVGGFGDDIMAGSSGRDVFTSYTYNSVDPTRFDGTGGRDVVADFHHGEDRIAVYAGQDYDYRDDPGSQTYGFSDFDLNKNGVLDAGDGRAVTIENVTFNGQTALSTVLHTPAPAIPADLVVFGVTDLRASDFVDATTTSHMSFDPRNDGDSLAFVGGYDNDVITGSNGADDIIDYGGHNVILAGGGDDRVEGGSGIDTISGGDGMDLISGNGGDDIIFGADGNDDLTGWTGNDRLYGGNGNDHLEGNDGDDKLYGGAGNDYLDGGIGHNILYGGAGDDVLQGTYDYFDVGTSDVMRGGAGNDTLQSSGNPLVMDSMFGDDGDDLLIGLGAQTAMHGGAGHDVFRPTGGTIADFKRGDDKVALPTSDTFAKLDSNHDGVLNGHDHLFRQEAVDFNGTAKQSLELLSQGASTAHSVPVLTLIGVTELHHADLIA